VETIRESSAPVAVSSRRSSDSGLQTPSHLRMAAASVGHGCVETKLGLSRSLPISFASATAGVRLPSLALAAYAAYRGGTVLTQTEAGSEATVSFTDRQDEHFAVSETYTPIADNEACSAIKPGDVVAHRFMKFTPSPSSDYREVLMSDAELSQLLVEDEGAIRERFAGKLVLLGFLTENRTIPDRFGNRDEIFWHADAMNNLLLDEAIVPMRDSIQFWLMLALAVLGVTLRMRFDLRRGAGIAILTAVTAALAIGAVYTYGNFGTLFNPAYHIVALWAAWALAGRAGRTWIL